MGRLTEAYGFCNVKPSLFTKLWVKHNITALTPSEELYVIRKQILSQKRQNKKDEETQSR
jgi:hypothetical protein